MQRHIQIRSAKCERRLPVPFDIQNPSFAISPRPTMRRLAIMNLALPGIDADFGPENADTFRRDLHPDLRADDVLANPPVNDSDTALRYSAFLHTGAKL